MQLKTRIWMTGSLEWFAYIGDEEVYLGMKEFPNPPEEGDEWTNRLGMQFKIIDGEIKIVGQVEPPKRYWL